ncbi:type II secretion system F family protein [Sinimarinibacterium sp. NLF-5-8]|uniref:type II secretion system F family protein n=1 Tax=Sinimarinibacterium sp. NLF-5-8 TaxID=2698684 RepID=UPI00137C1884|nr:type II secretion system F family protein [Sinimarinibacterium sp. NLF-5-8]QHS09315.1 type II secretion system F family protein [Sinimarinibacterium sp. NLF-5-8]
MSPALFGLMVAGVIVLVVGALAVLAILGLRSYNESRIRSRLAPELAQRENPIFDEKERGAVVTSLARGGKAIEDAVDTEGESARLMLQAGWRDSQTRLIWYLFQAALPVLMAIGVLIFWLSSDSPKKAMLTLMAAIVAAILSFLMPRWILRSIAQARQLRIKNEVPLLIHLLLLLFEAGLSTRQAMASLIRDGGSVLPEMEKELELLLRRLDAGAELDETLKNFGELFEVDDLNTVIAVLRQVDRYGGEIREPLQEALQVIEDRRSMDIREKVNLLSGRMTVVMVLFFFPALLIFVAGPAFLSIIRALSDING